MVNGLEMIGLFEQGSRSVIRFSEFFTKNNFCRYRFSRIARNKRFYELKGFHCSDVEHQNVVKYLWHLQSSSLWWFEESFAVRESSIGICLTMQFACRMLGSTAVHIPKHPKPLEHNSLSGVPIFTLKHFYCLVNLFPSLILGLPYQMLQLNPFFSDK